MKTKIQTRNTRHARIVGFALISNLLAAVAVSQAYAQVFRAAAPGQLVYSVKTIEDKPVTEGDVFDDAILFSLTFPSPHDLPTIKFEASKIRIAQGQIVGQVACSNFYDTLSKGLMFEGEYTLKKKIEFGLSAGGQPKLDTKSKTTMIPLFPIKTNSDWVRITGMSEFVLIPEPAEMRSLFFAPGAIHTLQLKNGEMILLDGICQRAVGDTEVQFVSDNKGVTKTTTKGKLVTLQSDSQTPR